MRKNTQGFTLIELLIVIAIIGILAAVLIPNLLDARNRAFDTAAQTCLKEISTAEEVDFIDNSAYNGSLGADIAACDDVTYSGATNASGYIYTGTHPQGSATFVVSPDTGVERQ